MSMLVIWVVRQYGIVSEKHTSSIFCTGNHQL